MFDEYVSDAGDQKSNEFKGVGIIGGVKVEHADFDYNPELMISNHGSHSSHSSK